MRGCLFLAVLAIGCGAPEKKKEDEAKDAAEPAPAPGPAPAVVPPPAEFAWKNSAPFKISGSGNKVPDQVELVAGPAAFKLTATGKSNFIVSVTPPGSPIARSLANEILEEGKPYTSTAVVEAEEAGRAVFEVKAEGEWTIESFIPEKAVAVPAKISGRGRTATQFFPMPAKTRYKIAAKHAGKSNFILHLVNASTGRTADFVINEIGQYEGETVAETGEADHYMFNVIADGDWELVISQL